MQVVGNDQRMSGSPVEKWGLLERKNSACSINKFQNKLSLLMVFSFYFELNKCIWSAL